MTPIEKAAQDIAFDFFGSVEPADIRLITKHLAPIQAELDELAKIRAILKEPGLVWVNMLRGEIARPQALGHYEECKMRVETLETELSEKDRLLKEAREMLRDAEIHCPFCCGTVVECKKCAEKKAWRKRAKRLARKGESWRSERKQLQ